MYNSFWSLSVVSLLLSVRAVIAQNDTEILPILQSIVDCDTCHAALIPLKALARTGDDKFSNAFVEACDEAQVDDPDVCRGLFTRLGPIIAKDLRSISTKKQTASRLCDALFGFCMSKIPNAFAVPLPRPAKPHASPHSEQPTPSPARAKPFQVIQISDVHIDRDYTVGSEANCTKNICCRNFTDEIGKPITEPAKRFGNSKCDSPTSLADSMLDAVNAINAKFVIFTGDVVAHDDWLTTREEVTFDLEDFNAEMLSRIKAKVFPSFGNHDSTPVNAFPRNTTETTMDIQWAYGRRLGGKYSSTFPRSILVYVYLTLPTQIKALDRKDCKSASGSYFRELCSCSARYKPDYWYKQNDDFHGHFSGRPDPNGILAFMVEQLQTAETAGKKVWIIGHIPLGKADTVVDQSNYYDQILQRYKTTIVGQFFGHSHKDQFEIAYSNYSQQTAANAVGVGLICPALTPTSGNPAFKVYDVDPDTLGIMNIRVIFANLTDPTFQKNPTWKLYYDTRQVYGPLVRLPSNSELTPAFWHNLTEEFARNETAFQLFNTFISRGEMSLRVTIRTVAGTLRFVT
ncbi:hypothetical protein D9757_000989 [Collybiopsis confluens]|uniref:Calcineurin-like phosphoesterase domain-containing protein n=1 Tax=Collybiopsis confluens TaxID=2823264 RepID=A0A8H5I0K6_9AGAR|nr:hypothetical protein D9757_000989 [Collybiopsis confluens]